MISLDVFPIEMMWNVMQRRKDWSVVNFFPFSFFFSNVEYSYFLFFFFSPSQSIPNHHIFFQKLEFSVLGITISRIFLSSHTLFSLSWECDNWDYEAGKKREEEKIDVLEFKTSVWGGQLIEGLIISIMAKWLAKQLHTMDH